MANAPDPFLIDDENPEWTEADFAIAKPFRELHPAWHAAWKQESGQASAETPAPLAKDHT